LPKVVDDWASVSRERIIEERIVPNGSRGPPLGGGGLCVDSSDSGLVYAFGAIFESKRAFFRVRERAGAARITSKLVGTHRVPKDGFESAGLRLPSSTASFAQ